MLSLINKNKNICDISRLTWAFLIVAVLKQPSASFPGDNAGRVFIQHPGYPGPGRAVGAVFRQVLTRLSADRVVGLGGSLSWLLLCDILELLLCQTQFFYLINIKVIWLKVFFCISPPPNLRILPIEKFYEYFTGKINQLCLYYYILLLQKIKLSLRFSKKSDSNGFDSYSHLAGLNDSLDDNRYICT